VDATGECEERLVIKSEQQRISCRRSHLVGL